jgi:hypothetical protein
MRKFSVIALLFLVSCVSSGELRVIQYEQNDLPEVRSIELLYRNDSGKRMCVLPEHWPNPAGAISDADTRVFLVVASERYAMRLFNAGYCVGGCAQTVESGEQLVARIPYDFFDLPDRLTSEPKRIEFQPMAYACRSR